MTAIDTRQFMALMAIAQHHGRPGTPTDQAHIESFFSHLKGDWPHLTEITDPAALDTELARIRGEYNTVRLHAAIGYVTPEDEHHGRGPAHPPRSRRRDASRTRRADQAESSQQEMTDLQSTDRARAPLGKRGAFEGVARRHGRRRNPARTTPRSSLRPPTNQALHSPQRGVRKVDCSIKGSETPHSAASISCACGIRAA